MNHDVVQQIARVSRAKTTTKRRANNGRQVHIATVNGADVTLFSRVPDFLARELNRLAAKRNVSRNALVVDMLAVGVKSATVKDLAKPKAKQKVTIKSAKGKAK
jgi:hypothetical protein